MPKEQPDKGDDVNASQSTFIEKRKYTPSLERQAFVEGLFQELNGQLVHLQSLVTTLGESQARVVVSENSLKLTRDYLQDMLENTTEGVPLGWKEILAKVRFAGARLGDACIEILKESDALTLDEIENELNDGQYRFKTDTPRREMNAAMLRHPNITRNDEGQWTFMEKPISRRGGTAKKTEAA